MYEEGKCVDCHDPHGDTAKSATPSSQALTGIDDDISTTVNAAMMQREVAYTDRWTSPFGDPTGKLYPPVRYFVENSDQGDFFKDNPSYSGICEGCHTADGFGGGPETKWFRREDADGEALPNFHDPAQKPEAPHAFSRVLL
jgi:mono/diheme cytochrome c family protein